MSVDVAALPANAYHQLEWEFSNFVRESTNSNLKFIYRSGGSHCGDKLQMHPFHWAI